MSDWVKVLIGALAGMLAGLVAEPLKQQIVTAITARRIKRELLSEITLIYTTFCNNHHGQTDLDWEQDNFLDNVRFTSPEKFLHYRDKYQDVCYRILGWKFIKSFFEQYIEIREKSIKGVLSIGQTCKEIRFEFVRHAFYGPEGNLLRQVDEKCMKCGYPRLNKKEIMLNR